MYGRITCWNENNCMDHMKVNEGLENSNGGKISFDLVKVKKHINQSI
jgi:hypothetical protein